MFEQAEYQALAGMAVGAALGLFGWWREKRRVLGKVPIIPPVYIQFTGLLLLLAFSAEFISAVTGFTWTSPFRR